MLRYLDGNGINFKKKLELILNKRKQIQKNKSNIVKTIIQNVKKNGDKSLVKYEKKFSKITKKKVSLRFTSTEIKKISRKIDKKLKNSIDIAFDRIKRFHDKQKVIPFKLKDKYK